MSINSELKKDGVTNIEELDTLKVNSIARYIAKKLCMAFHNYDLKESDLFIKLSRLHMYSAEISGGLSQAKYFYKNSSIYFSKDIDIDSTPDFAIHECIHALQESRDSRNNLIRLGLCTFSEFKLYGLALNEAAVQLMTAKATKAHKDTVKYYDIYLPTVSPDFYPLACNLVTQMAYITGEYLLFNSTLNSLDSFKEKFIDLCGENAFLKIQSNLDCILEKEELLESLNNELKNYAEDLKNIVIIKEKITKNRCIIKDLFINTQNLIMASYFTTQFSKLYTVSAIEDYRKKLYGYKNFIGTMDGYSFYDELCVDVMSKLDNKYELIKNNIEFLDNSLVTYKVGFFRMLLEKIKVLINKKDEQNN